MKTPFFVTLVNYVVTTDTSPYRHLPPYSHTPSSSVGVCVGFHMHSSLCVCAYVTELLIFDKWQPFLTAPSTQHQLNIYNAHVWPNVFLLLPQELYATFSLGEGGRDCGRGEIYSTRQSLGMQERDRQDCFQVIVPSSSSLRNVFVCRGFFVLFLCVFVSLWGK